ncbi:hypothetical protein TFLX_06605 [Thermoflexales bacterium]|nr:hypothetical protein TFLX_06605 [Thermoflexales bacterium]
MSPTYLKVGLSKKLKALLVTAVLFPSLCMAVGIISSRSVLWPLVLLNLVVFGGFVFFLWFQTLNYPRLIDDEGITKRNGTRLLWKDLRKLVRGTGKVEGIRVGGSLRLSFQDGEHVDIVPNSISPADAVTSYIYKKTGVLPG